MSRIILSVPSKTFLAGEYLALEGGGALLASTTPRFQMKVERYPFPGGNPFPPESPAGRLWTKHHELLQSYTIDFEDPHEKRGGWGASSAQFALLNVLIQQGDSLWDPHLPLDCDISSLLYEYEQIHFAQGTEQKSDKHKSTGCKPNSYKPSGYTPNSYKPSGADLVAQITGEITYFERNQNSIQKYPWIFSNLEAILIPTGDKVQTHLHLQELSSIDIKNLEQIMKSIYQSLKMKNEAQFLEGIHNYSLELQQLNLVANKTKEFIADFKDSSFGMKILAAKGCGAMGADVVAFFFKKDTHTQNEILQRTKNMGLNGIVLSESLEEGLKKEGLNRKDTENEH